MAIEPVMWDAIKYLGGNIKNRRVLCLGYPDILANVDAEGDEPEDAPAIKKWHRWKGKVLNADQQFKNLGLEPTYWDITKARGPEIIIDLNQPQAIAPVGMVIDPGTIEHIANIHQAFLTIVGALDIGGIVIHSNPLGMGNHGFFSIHPTMYGDFYHAHGCEVLVCYELSGPLEQREIRSLPQVMRFDMRHNAVMLVVAKKLRHCDPQPVIQSKYLRNPGLRVAK